MDINISNTKIRDMLSLFLRTYILHKLHQNVNAMF